MTAINKTMVIRPIYYNILAMALLGVFVPQFALAGTTIPDASQPPATVINNAPAANNSGDEAPVTLSFSDSQTLSVNLSETNINRIVVSGDAITHTVCPQGYCSATHNADDQSGAAYINVVSPIPFTVFFETQQGRHFSLQVTPRQMDGQTLILVPQGGSTVAGKWEKESDYRELLENLTRDMMNGKVPDGYGYTAISNADRSSFHGLASIQPIGVWGGQLVTGVAYQITNSTKEPLTLPPSAFYHFGVRSIAITDQTIPPHGTTMMYQIISSGTDANLGGSQ